MLRCRGATKHGESVRRHTVSVQLVPALQELFKLYERAGGPGEEVKRLIAAGLDACLAEGGREGAHAHLQHLLRAREVHVYIMAEPGLEGLKARVLEHLLFQPGPAERWAAVRDLLLEHMALLCEEAGGATASLECYKRALSQPGGTLGRLLVLTALVNFDLDAELPPDNLFLRFQPGRFPEHAWEVCSADGRVLSHTTEPGWRPRDPLCRWEYLAADLAHALFRRQHWGGARRAPAGAGNAWAATGSTGWPNAEEEATLYCRLEPAGPGRAEQLDLFPVEPAALRAELQRHVHRREGPDGVKLLALLLAASAATGAEPVLTLDLGEVVDRAGLGEGGARARRSRILRLGRVIELLAGVELTRVFSGGERATAQVSRLLTVLGRSDEWSGQAVPGDARALSGLGQGSQQPRLRLLLDSVFLPSAGERTPGLGAPFARLPEPLLQAHGREHPFLVPLYVHLQQAWATARAEGGPPVLEATARRLLQEAGLWVSETGRYRALEALKADLEHLREQGWLGGWRMQRAGVRDGMEDRYTMEAPEHRAAVPPPRAPEWAPAVG